MDARVPTTVIATAFGLPITVTRPFPDDTPVPTIGVWVPPGAPERDPVGLDFARRDPRRVIAIGRTTVLPSCPVGTVIDAPEQAGGSVVSWTVENIDGVYDVDLMRLVVSRTRL